MNIPKENIFAIPSKDRLNDESVDLLAQAGINVQIPGRQLSAETALPEVGRFTVALMRPKDIVKSVAAGEIQLGIAGLDTVEEGRLSLDQLDQAEQYRMSRERVNRPPNFNFTKILLGLEIGRTRLVLAAAENCGFKTEQEWWDSVKSWKGADERLRWLTVATSYPALTERFLRGLRPGLEDTDKTFLQVKEMSGAIEVAPAIGLADAIADLVETGTTLEANGLVELTTIFESEAVLITSVNRRGESRMVDAIYRRLYNSFLKRGADPFDRLRGYEQFRVLV